MRVQFVLNIFDGWLCGGQIETRCLCIAVRKMRSDGLVSLVPNNDRRSFHPVNVRKGKDHFSELSRKSCFFWTLGIIRWSCNTVVVYSNTVFVGLETVIIPTIAIDHPQIFVVESAKHQISLTWIRLLKNVNLTHSVRIFRKFATRCFCKQMKSIFWFEIIETSKETEPVWSKAFPIKRIKLTKLTKWKRNLNPIKCLCWTYIVWFEKCLNESEWSVGGVDFCWTRKTFCWLLWICTNQSYL